VVEDSLNDEVRMMMQKFIIHRSVFCYGARLIIAPWNSSSLDGVRGVGGEDPSFHFPSESSAVLGASWRWIGI
jgi:hypothetical protein